MDKMEAKREAVGSLLRERYHNHRELWMSNGTKGEADVRYCEQLERGRLFLPNAAVEAYYEVFAKEFPMRLAEYERFAAETGWRKLV